MAWKKPGDSAEIVEKFLPSKEGDLLQDFALAGVIRVFLKTPSQMILAGFPPSNSCKWSSWWLLVLKRRSHNLYHGIILFPIVSHVVYKVATSHRLNFSNLNDGLPNLPSIAAWWLRMGPDFPVVFFPTSCVGRWPVGSPKEKPKGCIIFGKSEKSETGIRRSSWFFRWSRDPYSLGLWFRWLWLVLRTARLVGSSYQSWWSGTTSRRQRVFEQSCCRQRWPSTEAGGHKLGVIY